MILKKKYLLLFIICISFSSLKIEGKTIVLDENTFKIDNIGLDLELLEDPENKLTIKEITSPEYSSNFIKSNYKVPVLGFTDSAVWVKFTILNKSKNITNWYIRQGFTKTHYIDFYSPRSQTSSYDIIKTGLSRSVKSRDIDNHLFIFNLKIPYNKKKTFYMKFKNHGTITIPLSILSPKAFQQSVKLDYLLLGLFYGIIFVIILYNFFIFLSLKERVYIYFILFLSARLCSHTLYRGISPYYLGSFFIEFFPILFSGFAALSSIFLISFTFKFFNLKKKSPLLNKIIYLIISSWAGVFLILFLKGFSPAIIYVHSLLIISYIIPFIYFSYAFIKKEISSKPFLFSWLLFCLLELYHLSIRKNIFENNLFSEHSWELGIINIALIWSYALYDRINLLYIEAISTQKKLQENEEKFRLLAENTYDIIWTTDINLKITYTNNSIQKILGYSPEEFIGMYPSDYIPQEKITLLENYSAEIFKNAIKGKTIQKIIETQYLHKKGNLVDVEITANPLFDKDKNYIGLQGTIKEISMRKKIEADRLRLIAILEGTSDLIFTAKPDNGQILYINTSAKKMLRWPLDDNYKNKFIPDLHPEWALEIIKLEGVPAAIENGSWSGETAIISPDGKEIPVSQVIMSHKSDKGKVEYLSTIMRNISEIKKTEEQLRQVQKMETIGNLAGGIAHDFNNALGGIVGVLSVLEYKIQNKEKFEYNSLKDYVEILKQSSDKATKLVQQLLNLSRKRKTEISKVNLNEIIKNVINICQNTLDKSIKIIVQYNPSNAFALADPVQIEQVLLNICINAGHAMTIMKNDKEKYGGTLTLLIKQILPDKYFHKRKLDIQEAQYWCISIIDTGVGMTHDTLSKIFDPFFTTKKEGEGTGLGLSMTYNIIKLHKGFLDVYSEPGVGTTFKIYIPVSNDSIEAIPVTENDETFQGEGLILVIDDEKIMRQAAKEILIECGYDVLLASNGTEGIKIYSKQYKKIKAVVLDMAMPGISGKETFIKMKKINPDIKAVLTSGFRQDIRIKEAMNLGINNFLEKPYTFKNLRKTMKKLIEN